jgi:glutamate 5-kinase
MSKDAHSDALRQEIAATANLVVVKVGTRVLTGPEGQLNLARIDRLAEELTQLRRQGKNVVLVSSGAVGAGMSQLGLKERPTDLPTLQAVAAIGQTNLIESYDKTFRKHGAHAAQVLLIADDLAVRPRYLNVRNTLRTLLSLGAIPIINENDTVSVDELKTTFGDNDRLAAMVATLLCAELLVILSDIEGLYDGDPKLTNSKVVSTVQKIDAQIESYVRDRKTGLSKGGMASKLEAARMVTSAGGTLLIASGRNENVLRDVFAGKPLGTLFLPAGKRTSPRKRWLGASARPRGKIVIDAGAQKAVAQKGMSLLSAGVTAAEGDFQKGDVVAICDAHGEIFARGLTNFSQAELQKIMGLKSSKIAQVLGYRTYGEVIHRDNLAVMRTEPQ